MLGPQEPFNALSLCGVVLLAGLSGGLSPITGQSLKTDSQGAWSHSCPILGQCGEMSLLEAFPAPTTVGLPAPPPTAGLICVWLLLSARRLLQSSVVRKGRAAMRRGTVLALSGTSRYFLVSPKASCFNSRLHCGDSLCVGSNKLPPVPMRHHSPPLTGLPC
jgi:hypothetical protein